MAELDLLLRVSQDFKVLTGLWSHLGFDWGWTQNRLTLAFGRIQTLDIVGLRAPCCLSAKNIISS